jgi:phage repressor protein C with HTH and peptisase S24 domain
MLSHESVWTAIDALAERHSLSVSGLAKRAGLDSTAFNKSKRLSADGRPRWPSTESLAKIIDATNSSLDEFFELLRGQVATGFPQQSSTVPLIGFAQAGAGGFFDDAGFPVGQGWDLVEIPGQSSDGAYALGCRAIPCCRSTGAATCWWCSRMRPCARAIAWWSRPYPAR